MPARRPHEAGLQLAGDPPSFEAYAQKPESEWHFAQDEWLAQFFEGKRTLPVPGKTGSAESKERAKAWRSAIKAHGKAKRMSLAASGDADANAVLNGEASYALHRAQAKKRAASEAGLHARPRGSAPDGYEWDEARGKWIDEDGDARPEATRNERRVEQRNASEEQTRKHKQKWELYGSHGRYRHRNNPPVLGIASPSGSQHEDTRRWKAHLEAVAAGRSGEFTPAAASSAQAVEDQETEAQPPQIMLRPPFPDPQRPAALPQIALRHCVSDRVEWYNNHHPDDCTSEPVFGWQPGTVVCTYNVCPMALADGAPKPYRTPGVADYTSEAECQFHFGCKRCTVQKPYAVRLDFEEGEGYRGYVNSVQPSHASRVRSLQQS